MAQRVLYRFLNDRARLLLRGPDRKRFLHGLVSNDIAGLRPGQGCHAAMLTVKGKLLGNMGVHDGIPDAEALLLQLEAASRAQVFESLERHLIMDDVTVSDVSEELGQAGVYGAGALFVDAELPPYHHAALAVDGTPVHVAATRELGMPGWHLFAPRALLPDLLPRLLRQPAETLSPLSEEEADVLRVEAGTPRYGIDADEERLPVEAHMDDAISFSKGCYLGQEVIARVTARGHVNRKLLGLRFPGADAVPARGSRLGHPARPDAGVVTSAVRSPRHGIIGLGYVHRSVWEPGTELTVLAGPDASATGAAAGKAIVAALPFAGP